MRTRSEVVADLIRNLINEGELRPGTRLRQAQIAERFGVSTSPVREAFASLTREGLLESDPHRGVVVFLPSHQEIVEIYEIRRQLEPLAASCAAGLVADGELALLEDLIEEITASQAASDDRHIVLNQRFHSTIYSASGRPRLVSMINSLRDASSGYMRIIHQRTDLAFLDRAAREHREVLAALRRRDSEAAAALTALHLQHGLEHLMQSIDDPEQRA